MFRARNVLLLLGLVIAIAGGIFVYDAVLSETEEASAPISSIPLELDTAPDPTATSLAAATEIDTESEATAVVSPTGTPQNSDDAASNDVTEPTSESEEPGAVEEDASESEASAQLTIYEIVPSASEVRFMLDEDLRGVRTTVVGRTDQVAGQLALNLNDLSMTQLGVIQVNARTLATDNSMRNRAIGNQILLTNLHEFITFEPTSVSGLNGSASVGDLLTFQVTGNLTITGITNPVTFDVTATAVSESEIQGTASTVVLRPDYSLSIPSLPHVANVEEEVEIEIEFAALAVDD
jgi:polyisoprenoid-binding protein YceI